MKRFVLALALALAFVLLLLGCQETPDTPFVVPKDSERLLGEGQEDAAPAAGEQAVPERYLFSSTGGDGSLIISVDAAVSVPTGEPFSIIGVNAEGFSPETVSHLFGVLFKDQTVYDSTQGKARDKAAIEREIQALTQQLADGSYADAGFSEEEWEALIAQLVEEYSTAPSSVSDEKHLADGQMHLVYDDGHVCNQLFAISEAGGHLQVRSNESARDADKSWLNYNRYSVPEYTMADAVKVDDDPASLQQAAEKVGMPFDKAQSLCMELLMKSNTDMEIAAAYVINDRAFGMSDGQISPAKNYAYKFFCARTVNGISVATDASTGHIVDEYNIGWAYELIEIVVDGKGPAIINWQYPIQITGVLKESVQTIPFSSASEIFERMVFTIYEPRTVSQSPELKSIHMDVTVDAVQLQYLRIRQQDTQGERIGMLVPAWVFYGSIASEQKWDNASEDQKIYVNSDGYSGNAFYVGPTIVLAINAIDGSVINVGLGY